MADTRAPPVRVATHAWVGLSLALLSHDAGAHSFGQTYTLPIPVWMYLYGASAALILSFVLVGFFVTAKPGEVRRREYDLSRLWAPGRRVRVALMRLLRALSVGALALTVLAGFFGTENPYRNVSMTLFWVVFCLGFTYLTALVGDWFSVLNPFRVLADAIERVVPGVFGGRYRYPAALEYWPALLLYIVFIRIELFGHGTPASLALALSVYAGLNLVGCWLVGTAAWFERCEFLGVFLRLAARVAPIRCDLRPQAGPARITLRQPFVGLLQERPIPVSLLLFVLFMISSTAFDGLKETALWVGAFWKGLYGFVLIPIYGDASRIGYTTIGNLFSLYQTVVLVLSPLIYLAVYGLFLASARLIVGNRVPLKTLLSSFGLCLVPIALAYHVTHYYTLLQVQGPQMIRLVSDPLGAGWDLFGTSRLAINVVPDLAVVWHAQVFLIIAGHVSSVYVAHLQALRLFPDRRTAVLSQVPVLLLMVGFTTTGLWILSLPLDAGARLRF